MGCIMQMLAKQSESYLEISCYTRWYGTKRAIALCKYTVSIGRELNVI